MLWARTVPNHVDVLRQIDRERHGLEVVPASETLMLWRNAHALEGDPASKGSGAPMLERVIPHTKAAKRPYLRK